MLDVGNYEEQIASLNLAYVIDAGDTIRSRLFPLPNRNGVTPYALPAGIAYQPGNGTRYDLVFVPTRTLRQLTAETVPVGFHYPDMSPIEGGVLVARTNSEPFAATFDLSLGNPVALDTVVETTRLGFADACALTALLRAVAGAQIQ